MNIFEIFCYGNGRITETNMSSILGFILDPTASHGYGRSTITEFLRPLDRQLVNLINRGCFSSLTSKGDGIRELIGRAGAIEIELEETFIGLNDEKKEKARTLDLLIKIIDANGNIKLIIAIENKIYKESSVDKRQLIEEYRYLRESIDLEIPIIFIYLTPKILTESKEDKLWFELNSEFSQLVDKYTNDLIASYSWLNHSEKTITIQNNDPSTTIASISAIAGEILRQEQSGLIDPASSHSNLLIRSMMRFIENEFRPKYFGNIKSRSDNRMQVNENSEAFWTNWPLEKAGAKSFAQNIIDLINKVIHECQQDMSESVNLIFRSSRLRYAGFVTRNTIETVNLEMRSLKGRIFTLRCDGRTCSTVIEMSFSRPQKMTMDEFRQNTLLSTTEVELLDVFEQSKTIALFKVKKQLEAPVKNILSALTIAAFDAAIEEI